MAKHERQAYERLGAKVLTLALAVLVIGFASTFVTRARRSASSELSDLTTSTA
jgi:hypothetical protein